MKLATFHYQGRDRLGVALDDEQILDLTGANLPTSMRGLIELGDVGLALIGRMREQPDQSAIIPQADIQWLPPVRRPGKVLCVAMNNSASNARKISAPDHPLYFNKPATSLIGHQQPIQLHDHYGSVHPEPELAVIIGRRGRDILVEEAYDYVYGYTNFNDITGNGMRAEDRVHYWALYANPDDPDQLERREQHLSYAARYKGADTFGPVGPWLVTRDEIPDPSDLDVVCTFGGEVIAQDSTQYYNYPVHDTLAFISRYHTLEPGDMISMGTAFRPSPDSKRSLHLANLNRIQEPVSVSITGLGTLVNPVEKLS
jgi:2-keto-4-pentenoate hydratase/2-oxohepta-3-ene-1,7-dioic acid hydratase in catechol pathway